MVKFKLKSVNCKLSRHNVYIENLDIGDCDDNIVGLGVEGVVCDKFSVLLQGGKPAIYKRGKFKILQNMAKSNYKY